MTLQELRQVTAQKRWASHALSLISTQPPSTRSAEDLGTYWVEAGHHIREQLADDGLLVQLLRHILPPYDGGEMILYRGENQERWESCKVGPAWTSNPHTAKMFARGLNAVGRGGVLLKGSFDSRAIISGPNGHSHYLSESQFTVDPTFAIAVTAVEFFPAVK